jgi:hypothetical protein
MPKYEIAKFDLENIKRQVAKFPSRTPTDVEKIPAPNVERDLLRRIRGHAIWLILTYGADLIGYVSPFAAKVWKKFIKWRFNWTSKDLPFDLG